MHFKYIHNAQVGKYIYQFYLNDLFYDYLSFLFRNGLGQLKYYLLHEM